jgi:hypothetical protein
MPGELETAVDAMANLSDIQMFAKMIANMVADEGTQQLGSTYIKICGGIISVLVSTITYLYMTQKTEREKAEDASQQANDRLFAVLAESTRLMETVKNGLKDSVSSEKRTKRTLERMVTVVRGCAGRDNRLDNLGLDDLMDQGDNDE